jgi:cobyrinic acid a,c-diamide synthase
MSLIIAGERSGVGKTTLTLALLATLQRQQRSVQSFKVGPDYIDPMFHRYITGRACRNLDPVLTSPAYVQQCFQQHSQEVDYAIVEGVMGLFDGATGTDDWASTAHIARLLDLPVLLVLDCSRLSRSIAAIAHGYQTFDPRIQLAGLALNRVGSDRHLDLLKTALEPLQLPILGTLRRQDNITIPDRHLGLVPTAELPELDAVIDRLAGLGETCFDWGALLPLLETQSSSSSSPASFPSASFPASFPASSLRIAVAYDRAFSFYYPDNLELLEQLGAELVFWSPLQDAQIPAVQGLYFGGGFPEVFAEPLSANWQVRQAVRRAIEAGMPTYAECGGLMYLAEQLVDFQGQAWEMVGVLPTTVRMENRLTLGYRQSLALQDSPLMAAGEAVWGHEFHHSVLLTQSDRSLYKIRGYDSQSLSIEEERDVQEGWQIHQVHASYVHLHWGARPEIPARFLQFGLKYAQGLLGVRSPGVNRDGP